LIRVKNHSKIDIIILHKTNCQDWKNDKKYERIKLLKIPEQSISFDPTFIINRELFSVFYSDVYLSAAGVKPEDPALPVCRGNSFSLNFRKRIIYKGEYPSWLITGNQNSGCSGHFYAFL